MRRIHGGGAPIKWADSIIRWSEQTVVALWQGEQDPTHETTTPSGCRLRLGSPMAWAASRSIRSTQRPQKAFPEPARKIARPLQSAQRHKSASFCRHTYASLWRSVLSNGIRQTRNGGGWVQFAWWASKRTTREPHIREGKRPLQPVFPVPPKNPTTLVRRECEEGRCDPQSAH